MTPQGQQMGAGAPPPQAMEPSRALGLWQSNFGSVKIEADNSKGGLQTGAVHGIWVYKKQGQETIGYFNGNLRGNVLDFSWQEPSNPPLVGQGYLVFDADGRQYAGRWWNDTKDRVGAWNGWRVAGTDRSDPYAGQMGDQGYADPNAYGGQTYGQPPPYSQPPAQPYPPRQPQPYPPAPAPPPRY